MPESDSLRDSGWVIQETIVNRARIKRQTRYRLTCRSCSGRAAGSELLDPIADRPYIRTTYRYFLTIAKAEQRPVIASYQTSHVAEGHPVRSMNLHARSPSALIASASRIRRTAEPVVVTTSM